MTSRQFYIVLAITVICIKIQKFPCLLSYALQKNGFVLILMYFLINLLSVALACVVLKKTKDKSLGFDGSKGMKFLKKASMLVVAIYFFVQGILLYESIQDLFAHILFDNLPWTIFSLLLIVAVFFLAKNGITCIARNFELYAFIIFASIFIISIFGAIETKFSSILPLEEIDFGQIFDVFISFNLWFGDFFLVLALGKFSNGIKFKWIMLTYALSMALVVLMDIEFFGIYGLYSSLQPSLISVLSEQSMLGVNVGRVDWFLILFTQIGTILSSALCFFLTKMCLKQTFERANETLLMLGVVILLYILDAFVLIDIHIKVVVFLNYVSYFSFAVKAIVLAVMLAFAFKRESGKKATPLKNSGREERTL